MKRLLFLAAAAGMLAAAGCASDGGYVGAGYGYNYAGPADDVWYDGYYGPYSDGYWNSGGAFFFRGQDGHYYRDQANHFRTSSFNGSQHFTAHHRGGGTRREP